MRTPVHPKIEWLKKISAWLLKPTVSEKEGDPPAAPALGELGESPTAQEPPAGKLPAAAPDLGELSGPTRELAERFGHFRTTRNQRFFLALAQHLSGILEDP